MAVTLTLVLVATILALLAILVLARQSHARTTRRLLTVLDKYTDREIVRQERQPARWK